MAGANQRHRMAAMTSNTPTRTTFTLSRRERLLLTLVTTTLLLVGGLLLLQWLQKEKRALTQRLAELRPELVVQDFLLEDEDYWKEAREWIIHQAGPLPNLNERRAQLLEFAQSTATASGIRLTAPGMPPATTNPEGFSEVRATFDITGSWEAIVRFLSRIEDPPSFQAIAELRLTKTREEDIKASVVIVRYFPGPNLVAAQAPSD